MNLVALCAALLLSIGLGLAGCTRVYNQQELDSAEQKQLRDLSEDEKEEAGITRRITVSPSVVSPHRLSNVGHRSRVATSPWHLMCGG